MPDWDGPIKKKAPNGAGHLGKDGYRYIYVDGRYISEHRLFMEQLLGRRLNKGESVHHLNGHRADNRTDGPLRLVNGKLRSGNLELWSSAQPGGQEIGPKLLWSVELQEEYVEHLQDEVLERMAALLAQRGYGVIASLC